MPPFKRNIILNINRYQQSILVPVLLSASMACLMSIVCLIYLLADITETKMIYNIKLTDIQIFIPWIMMGISYLLLFVVFWTYYISNKLVGPFQRVVRELDEVIDGTKTTPIGTRVGDKMFEELLERINKIIERKK